MKRKLMLGSSVVKEKASKKVRYLALAGAILAFVIVGSNKAYASYQEDVSKVEASWLAQLTGATNTRNKPQYAYALAYVMAAAQNGVGGGSSYTYEQYNRMDVDAQFRLFHHILELYESGNVVEGGFADEMPFTAFHDKYGEQIWDFVEPMLGRAGGYGKFLQHVDEALGVLANYSPDRDVLNLSGQEGYYFKELVFAQGRRLFAEAVGEGVVWAKAHEMALELGPDNNFVKMLQLTVGPGTGILNCVGCSGEEYLAANPEVAVLYNTEVTRRVLADLKPTIEQLEAGLISKAEFDALVREAVTEIVADAVSELKLELSQIMEVQNQILGELHGLVDTSDEILSNTFEILDQLKSIGVDLKALRKDVKIIRLFAENEYNEKQHEAYQAVVKARSDVKWAGVQGAFYLASSLASLMGDDQLANSIGLAGKGLVQIAKGVTALESTLPLFDQKTFNLMNASTLTLEASALGQTLAMVGGIANIVQGATVLAQAFGVGGPTADELILQGIQQLSQQIVETEERIHLRFDRVDEQLAFIVKQNFQTLRAIADLNAGIDEVKSMLVDMMSNSRSIESTLNRLRSEFLDHSEHYHRNQLKLAVDAINEYEEAFGLSIPEEDFIENMQRIHTYAVDGSREIPVVSPTGPFSYGDDWFGDSAWLEQADRLRVLDGSDGYAHSGMDRNLDFVIDLAMQNYGVTSYPADSDQSTFVAARADRKVGMNPVDFFRATSAFLSITRQFPELSIQLNPSLYTGEDFGLDRVGLQQRAIELRLQQREIESLAYPTIAKAVAALGAPQCTPSYFGSNCPATELGEFDKAMNGKKWTHAAAIQGPFGSAGIGYSGVWGSDIPRMNRLPENLWSKWLQNSRETCESGSSLPKSATDVHTSTRVLKSWYPSSYETKPVLSVAGFLYGNVLRSAKPDNLNHLVVAGMLGVSGAEALSMCVVNASVSQEARNTGVWPQGATYPVLNHAQLKDDMLLRTIFVSVETGAGEVAKVKLHEKARKAYLWYSPKTYFELVEVIYEGSEPEPEPELPRFGGNLIQQPSRPIMTMPRVSLNPNFSNLIFRPRLPISEAPSEPEQPAQPVLPVVIFPTQPMHDVKADIVNELQRLRRDFYHELREELHPNHASNGYVLAGMRAKLEAHARMIQVMLALAYPDAVSSNELVRSIVFGTGLDVFNYETLAKLIDLKIAETHSSNLGDGGSLMLGYVFADTARAIRDFNEAAWAEKWNGGEFEFASDVFTDDLMERIDRTARYFRPTEIDGYVAQLEGEAVRIEFDQIPDYLDKVRLLPGSLAVATSDLPGEDYTTLRAANVLFRKLNETGSQICMEAASLMDDGFVDMSMQILGLQSTDWETMHDDALEPDVYGDVCLSTNNRSGEYRLIGRR